MRGPVCGLAILLSVLAGCVETEPAAPEFVIATADLSQPETSTGPTITEWSSRAPQPLAVRLHVGRWQNRKSEPLLVGLEVRNLTGRPLTVLRPFADHYADVSNGIELIGSEGACRYVGPTPSQALGESAFAVIEAHETFYGRTEIHWENYEGAERPGAYRIRFHYRPAQRHREKAASFELDELVIGEWSTTDVQVLNGPVADDESFEQSVKIAFPRGGYSWTLDEVAGGVTLAYDVIVTGTFERVSSTAPGSKTATGFCPLDSIRGNGQSYHPHDHGHPGPPEFDGHIVLPGRTRHALPWDRRNWTGPSDFDNPKGPPFPAGTYRMEVVLCGQADTGGGLRPFRIARSTTVTLQPR